MNTKPNVILITTDQQRFDTIQKLGNDAIYTPHLNWLVSEGITFTRCYADCPICVPSRTTIMTGKKAYVSGITNNQNHYDVMTRNTTLPKLLTENGYQTRAVGKMHFEPARAHYGFEHMLLPLDYYREYRHKSTVANPKHHGVGENEVEPVISTVHENDSLTTWTVDKSIDFIETRDTTRPFFMWTSFSKPHPPLDPCFNYWAIYDNIQLPLPVYGDWSHDLDTMPKGYLKHTFALNNMHLFKPQQLQAIKRAYYACITQIDYSLGLLFARLREEGLFDNTWIVFTSDHGDMMGDHHMGAKFTYTEGAAHVPFIVRPPNGVMKELKGRRCDVLTELSDIYPSILEMVGLERPEGLDGESVFTILNQQEDRLFFGNCENTTFCAMRHNVKYIINKFGGAELLFDLNNDPYETSNLVEHDLYQDILTTLRQDVLSHIEKYNPELLEDGKLILHPAPLHDDDTFKWPGFHSTTCEEVDVLH
ncbi:MAG: sulfatase-like hydrolase/transferase [Cellulosilyticaceae bacterium]